MKASERGLYRGLLVELIKGDIGSLDYSSVLKLVDGFKGFRGFRVSRFRVQGF